MYNFGKLIGRTKELGYTHEQLANEIGVNKSTLSSKLNNRSNFTTKEIDDICKVLEIPNNEIVDYFFTK